MSMLVRLFPDGFDVDEVALIYAINKTSLIMPLQLTLLLI
jgi:hypothetical protein